MCTKCFPVPLFERSGPMDSSECSAGTILCTFVLTDCYKIVDASCVIFSLFPALVLQAVHYMRRNEYLPYMLLSGRATSKHAITFWNVPLRRIANSLHRASFVETRIATLGIGKSLALHPSGRGRARSGPVEPLRGQHVAQNRLSGRRHCNH